MSELGRNKILLLLMADRDALGSTGGNKGYVGNSFIGIDPGHALEGGLLGRRGDVRSDFSFAQPGLVPSLGYKNFSMFDQSTLAEKMEGVRMIASLARSKADTGIFDSYARSSARIAQPKRISRAISIRPSSCTKAGATTSCVSSRSGWRWIRSSLACLGAASTWPGATLA